MIKILLKSDFNEFDKKKYKSKPNNHITGQCSIYFSLFDK